MFNFMNGNSFTPRKKVTPIVCAEMGQFCCWLNSGRLAIIIDTSQSHRVAKESDLI